MRGPTLIFSCYYKYVFRNQVLFYLDDQQCYRCNSYFALNIAQFLRCQDPGSLVNCTLQYPVQCCAIYFYKRFTRCDNSSPRSQINSGIFHVRNVLKKGRGEPAVVYFTEIETEGNPSRITPTSSVRVRRSCIFLKVEPGRAEFDFFVCFENSACRIYSEKMPDMCWLSPTVSAGLRCRTPIAMYLLSCFVRPILLCCGVLAAL